MSGTLGVMKIKGQEIYFEPDEKQLRVPKYLYKVIKEKTAKEGEVYVIYNNPHEDKKVVEQDIINDFEGKAISLDDEDKKFSEVHRGYTVKLPYDYFIETVNYTKKPRYDQIRLSKSEIKVFQNSQARIPLQVEYEMKKLKKQKAEGN